MLSRRSCYHGLHSHCLEVITRARKNLMGDKSVLFNSFHFVSCLIYVTIINPLSQIDSYISNYRVLNRKYFGIQET